MKKELPLDQKKILYDKLKGFSLLICESLIHIDACLTLENCNFSKLNQEEILALRVTHFKLSIIEASKLLSFRITDDGRFKKNDNDKFSVYAILAFIEGFKPLYKSENLKRNLCTLKAELSTWKHLHADILALRNEGCAHLGTEQKREKLNSVDTRHLNNLIVLLNDFHSLINNEYQLGFTDLMSLDLEVISKVYKKGFL